MTKARDAICSVDDCNRLGPLSRGLCKKHYLVWWRASKPDLDTAARERAVRRVIELRGRPKPHAKWCSQCQTDKPINQFRENKCTQTGLAAYCLPCERKYSNAYHKNWRDLQTPDERYAHSRKWSLMTAHGLTVEQYDEMLVAQDGKCAICETKDSGRRDRTEFKMFVDHCHNTNVIRGLLCSSCNFGLGKFKDDPDKLLAAATYLLRYVNVLDM